MKKSFFSSIGFKIIAFYTLISLITLSFIVSIIFENQAETIAKNTVLESEKKLSRLISSVKHLTIEMKEGALFDLESDSELIPLLAETVSAHYSDFLILSESEQVLHKSSPDLHLPVTYKEDSLRAHTSLTFSGREYFMRIDEAAKRIYFYIPVKEISVQDSSGIILFISQSTATISEARKSMYLQALYVIFVIFVFHSVFPVVLYRALIYPLRVLNKTTDKFASGDFNSRVNFGAREDEIGSLAASFNSMAEAIHRNFESFSREVKNAKTVSRAAETISTRDVVTGLVNTNYLTERIDDEIIQSKVRGSSIGLLLIDIDNFGSKNDMYGNQTADILLLETVRKIRECCGDADILARYGSDKFAVLCPSPEEEYLHSLSKKIHDEIETNKIITPDGTVFVTVSIGTAFIPAGRMYSILNYVDLTEIAKSALVSAKSNGKNRVERSS